MLSVTNSRVASLAQLPTLFRFPIIYWLRQALAMLVAEANFKLLNLLLHTRVGITRVSPQLASSPVFHFIKECHDFVAQDGPLFMGLGHLHMPSLQAQHHLIPLTGTTVVQSLSAPTTSSEPLPLWDPFPC